MTAAQKRLTVLALCLLALAACDRRASQPAREHPAATQGDASSSGQAQSRPDPRKAAVPKVDGKPMWTANRRYTAEENAQRGFERNGADFSAASVEDYVKTAHAFIASPPKGAETIKRANGDTLIYDAASNTFAVASKDGAPRTLFKPREGAAYWTQQKEREASGGSNRQAGRRRASDADEG